MSVGEYLCYQAYHGTGLNSEIWIEVKQTHIHTAKRIQWLCSLIRHSWSVQSLSLAVLLVCCIRNTWKCLWEHLKENTFSHHTGNVVRGPSDVIAVCQSLQQVAEKCQQDPESCWYFHQTAVPCLLALAVQASMPGNFFRFSHPPGIRPSAIVAQHCHPLGIDGTAFCTISVTSFGSVNEILLQDKRRQHEQWQEAKSTS